MKIEEYRVILKREGFMYSTMSYWYGNDMFAFEVRGCLFILPDFNYDKKEKKWCTYSNTKSPYFKLTNKFIDGKRQGCRYYSAKGYVLDADWNAAINIKIVLKI